MRYSASHTGSGRCAACCRRQHCRHGGRTERLRRWPAWRPPPPRRFRQMCRRLSPWRPISPPAMHRPPHRGDSAPITGKICTPCWTCRPPPPRRIVSPPAACTGCSSACGRRNNPCGNSWPCGTVSVLLRLRASPCILWKNFCRGAAYCGLCAVFCVCCWRHGGQKPRFATPAPCGGPRPAPAPMAERRSLRMPPAASPHPLRRPACVPHPAPTSTRCSEPPMPCLFAAGAGWNAACWTRPCTPSAHRQGRSG